LALAVYFKNLTPNLHYMIYKDILLNLKLTNTKSIFKILLLVFAVSFLSACSSGKKVNNNFSYLYNKEARSINLELNLYQFSEDSARIYYKISKADLLFSMRNKVEIFEARVLLQLSLKESLSAIAFDTINWVVKIPEKPETVNYFTGSKNIKLKKQKFTAELRATDLNKLKSTESFIEVDLTSPYAPEKFKVVNAENGNILFNNYIGNNDLHIIESKLYAGKSIDAFFYNRRFDLPPPPSANNNKSSFNYIPDKYLTLEFESNGSCLIELPGFGFISTVSSLENNTSFSIFKFRENYPYIPTAKEMIYGVRYLTNNDEYEKLLNNSDSKAAIDSFWLTAGGSMAKAKKLIKIYYNRQQESNIYFNSYTEGWRTDRGLIYTIFGSPDIIQKKNDNEIWIYGEEEDLNSYSFTFVKVNNPFSKNDYQLMRDPAYKSIWFLMVDNWRKGRIKE